MDETRWFKQFGNEEVDLAGIAGKAAKRPGMLAEVFEGLRADRPRIKYGCAKVLRLVSEDYPAALYPQFDRVVALLESDNKILEWTAIIAIGNLAGVDCEGRIEKIAARYLEPIRGPVMITAANVIVGAAKIALAKPKLADKIAQAILKVEAAQYQTPECRNVALGHSINSLAQFFAHLSKRQAVVNMVRRQLHNPRQATRRKAERFLKRYGLHAA